MRSIRGTRGKAGDTSSTPENATVSTAVDSQQAASPPWSIVEDIKSKKLFTASTGERYKLMSDFLPGHTSHAFLAVRCADGRAKCENTVTNADRLVFKYATNCGSLFLNRLCIHSGTFAMPLGSRGNGGGRQCAVLRNTEPLVTEFVVSRIAQRASAK